MLPRGGRNGVESARHAPAQHGHPLVAALWCGRRRQRRVQDRHDQVISGNSIGVDLRRASRSRSPRGTRAAADVAPRRAGSLPPFPATHAPSSAHARAPPSGSVRRVPDAQAAAMMTLMWHPDGFQQSDLHKVMEKAYQWSYARNIGVPARRVPPSTRWIRTTCRRTPSSRRAATTCRAGRDLVRRQARRPSRRARAEQERGSVAMAECAPRALTRARARALSLASARGVSAARRVSRSSRRTSRGPSASGAPHLPPGPDRRQASARFDAVRGEAFESAPALPGRRLRALEPGAFREKNTVPEAAQSGAARGAYGRRARALARLASTRELTSAPRRSSCAPRRSRRSSP